MSAPGQGHDPLLAGARVLLIVAMGVTLVGAAASVVSAALLLVRPAQAFAWLAEHAYAPLPAGTIDTLLGLLGLMIAISLASFLAQGLLLRVIDSVRFGDPFVPGNARRLAQIAWLALGIQLLALPTGALSAYVEYLTGERVGRGSFVSFGGVLLVLVLFILARVFRQGARMREELEGTV